MVELFLTLAPALLVLALLWLGCFPGEAQILKRRVRQTVRRLRAPRLRFPRSRAAALTSALERSPLTLRGPPATT